MEENKLLEERKERFLKFLKSDKLLSTFLILAALSLIFALLVNIGITALIGRLSSFLWLMLAIFSVLSALLVYLNKRKFALYPIAVWVAILAYKIRTLNLSRLRDVTTGGWILGPDLDPFLFLRWAKYIVENGAIMANDAMRYVPLGYDTARELVLLPYMIAWFHKFASILGSVSVEQSAALFPAFMFALTVIAFFFMVRKMFINSLGASKAGLIAIIASIFLSIMPSFIPRTVAGIPEKESAAFVFLFLAFCFLLYAWDAKGISRRIILAVLAGASTALMALVWGGYFFAFLTISLTFFLAFILGKVDKSKALIYLLWLVATAAFTLPFTARYSLMIWLGTPATALSFAVLGIIAVDFVINKTRLKNLLTPFRKIPRPITSLIISGILGVIFVSVLFGPSFIIDAIDNVRSSMVTPIVDRLGLTVAENKQPYFNEWANNFGPAVAGIPLTFWLFFIGSAYLFWNMSKVFKKREKVVITAGYIVFLICIIFSRYAPNSVMNGVSGTSILVYLLGFVALLSTFGYYYYRYYKVGEESKLRDIEFGLLLIFSFFFLCIIAARSAIRLTMMLVPPASIIVAYFSVTSFVHMRRMKEASKKFVAAVIVLLIIISTLFAGYQFYNGSSGLARSYAPSDYNQQWQYAMSWVRDNTSQDAVFGHWWDYGYWVQTLGERATVLDGGNSIAYWDHLMGRYALTGTNDTEAMEFLYAHETTHFLIDSTDIGKYPAFSSIGSDLEYDRRSWINTFVKDNRQTYETKNSTFHIYTGSFGVDEDLIYYENGTKIFIPEGANAGIAAIITERDSQGKIVSNPKAIFVYAGQQHSIPLRYAHDGEGRIDFGSGLEAGIFMVPRVQQTNAGIQIDEKGTLMYLSEKTVNGQLARLYLYKEENEFYTLVHSEDNSIVKQLKAQNYTEADIINYQGIKGPIRIWEINYPSGIEVNQFYLEKEYHDKRLAQI